MDSAQTALLVIDVQQELFEKSNPIYQADSFLANIQLLIDRAHRAKTQVVFIQHSTDKILIQGTPGWQFHSSLQPAEIDWVVQKHHGNAFEKTTLQSQLEARQIRRLVICGLVTHGCVRATCLGGLKLGYAVTLAQDAHSSFSPDAAERIEEWNHKLGQAGASVMSTEEICF